MFSIIVAVDANNGISRNGVIPWKCPNELEHFKTMTDGHVVIMGRKTWDSSQRHHNKQPNNRINVVITKSYTPLNTTKKHPDIVVNSITDVLIYFAKNKKKYKGKQLFVIGGESIYKQFLDHQLVSDVHITVINEYHNCDQFVTFPELTRFKSYKLCPNSIYYHCHTINPCHAAHRCHAHRLALAQSPFLPHSSSLLQSSPLSHNT